MQREVVGVSNGDDRDDDGDALSALSMEDAASLARGARSASDLVRRNGRAAGSAAANDNDNDDDDEEEDENSDSIVGDSSQEDDLLALSMKDAESLARTAARRDRGAAVADAAVADREKSGERSQEDVSPALDRYRPAGHARVGRSGAVLVPTKGGASHGSGGGGVDQSGRSASSGESHACDSVVWDADESQVRSVGSLGGASSGSYGDALRRTHEAKRALKDLKSSGGDPAVLAYVKKWSHGSRRSRSSRDRSHRDRDSASESRSPASAGSFGASSRSPGFDSALRRTNEARRMIREIKDSGSDPFPLPPFHATTARAAQSDGSVDASTGTNHEESSAARFESALRKMEELEREIRGLESDEGDDLGAAAAQGERRSRLGDVFDRSQRANGGSQTGRPSGKSSIKTTDEAPGAPKSRAPGVLAQDDGATSRPEARNTLDGAAPSAAAAKQQQDLLALRVHRVPTQFPLEREASERSRGSFQSRSSFRSRGSRSRGARARRRTDHSEVSSLDSFASPVFQKALKRDDSFSSLDSLASPTHGMAVKKLVRRQLEEQERLEGKRGGAGEDGEEDEGLHASGSAVQTSSKSNPGEERCESPGNGSPQISGEGVSKGDTAERAAAVAVTTAAPGVVHDREKTNHVPRHFLEHDRMERDDASSRAGSVQSMPRRSSLRSRKDDGSMSVDDVFDEAASLDPYQTSGLADDVALHLESSCKSMTARRTSDGIDLDLIDPAAEAGDDGRDDLDFALNAYIDAVKFGHFDFDDDAEFDEEAVWEGGDRAVAARAYMGLGFGRQIRGELESSLEAYEKALTLLEDDDEAGDATSVVASVRYAVGAVLVEMQNPLEAVDHFQKALRLYKKRKNPDDVGARASILSTEGMLFSVLGEARRAVDCFREAARVLLLAQGTDGTSAPTPPRSLKFASAMFEAGSILSRAGLYDDAAQSLSMALGVRAELLGDSFVVARTHYSLGVTRASQELEGPNGGAATQRQGGQRSAESHLEEALRICDGEFEGEDHLQSAVVVHALGVLNERRGDFLAASIWFAKERNMRRALFGEDHETVASVSADLGTCYYNSGKYELAVSTFEDGLRIVLLAEDDRSQEVSEALYKIASCHDSLCNYDEALEKFYEVKKIRESLFGMGSSPAIQTMLRIGNIQLCKGEVKKAHDCFSEVLGIGYASDNVNAVEVANALYGRGCAQFCGFHLADAMKSFGESLNWKLAALGEDDPGLACIFYQMAHVYLEQSEHDEAITCFEEYSRLQKLEVQRNLHDNAEICYAEGIVAKLRGRQDAALSFYNQALAMFDTLFGGEHEKIASIHFDIGCVHSSMGNFDAALLHFQTSLLQRRKLLGGHVDVANALYEMASIYSQQDSVQLAMKCLTESDRIWKAKLRNNEKLTSVLLLSGKLWKSLECYQATSKACR